jgi:hypothetical protein
MQRPADSRYNDTAEYHDSDTEYCPPSQTVAPPTVDSTRYKKSSDNKDRSSAYSRNPQGKTARRGQAERAKRDSRLVRRIRAERQVSSERHARPERYFESERHLKSKKHLESKRYVRDRHTEPQKHNVPGRTRSSASTDSGFYSASTDSGFYSASDESRFNVHALSKSSNIFHPEYALTTHFERTLRHGRAYGEYGERTRTTYCGRSLRHHHNYDYEEASEHAQSTHYMRPWRHRHAGSSGSEHAVQSRCDIYSYHPPENPYIRGYSEAPYSTDHLGHRSPQLLGRTNPVQHVTPETFAAPDPALKLSRQTLPAPAQQFQLQRDSRTPLPKRERRKVRNHPEYPHRPLAPPVVGVYPDYHGLSDDAHSGDDGAFTSHAVDRPLLSRRVRLNRLLHSHGETRRGHALRPPLLSPSIPTADEERYVPLTHVTHHYLTQQ